MPYRAIGDDKRPYRAIWNHKGTYQTIQDHAGDHKGPYRTIYGTRQKDTGQSGTTRDHKDPCWIMGLYESITAY